MKRILVPTDFSVCANHAVEMAMLLAGQNNSALYFLHLTVSGSDVSHVPGKSVAQKSDEVISAEIGLKELVSEAERRGLRAHQELVVGNGGERIEDYIKPLDIDFLVMGSHGSSGIRELVLGSKTQHVIRNIRIPSLVVKQKPKADKIDSIVFASTFKRDTSFALKVVAGLSRRWGSKLNLLFLNLFNHLIAEEIAHKMMRDQMKAYSDVPHTFNVTETNDKEFGIAQFASQIKADLISVPLEPKSAIRRFFNPSLAEQLINHSKLPVLVVPASK
ncbi:MAG: universal stress protein [Cyclobacteriaceae bacterium]